MQDAVNMVEPLLEKLMTPVATFLKGNLIAF